MAWTFAKTHMKKLLAKTDALAANSYAPGLFTFFSDASRIAELERYAKSDLPPTSAKDVAKAVDEVGFRAEFKSSLAAQIGTWFTDTKRSLSASSVKRLRARTATLLAGTVGTRRACRFASSSCTRALRVSPAGNGLTDKKMRHDANPNRLHHLRIESQTRRGATAPTNPITLAICRLRISPSGNHKQRAQDLAAIERIDRQQIEDQQDDVDPPDMPDQQRIEIEAIHGHPRVGEPDGYAERPV